MWKKLIFNGSLLTLILSMAAFDSKSIIPCVTTLISSLIVLLFAKANGWLI